MKDRKKKKSKKHGEYGKPQKVKKAKKLTQAEEDILGLARQVLKLEAELRDLRVHIHTLNGLASTVSSLERRLRAASEALK